MRRLSTLGAIKNNNKESDMSDAILQDNQSRTPWHLWVVAILVLLWNGSGAITIMMAQAGTLPNLTPDETAYYASQSLALVVLTDVALLTPLAAAIALMFRSKAAVWLFAVSLICIFVTDTWGILDGTSRALANTTALVVTCIIFVLAVLELIYARAMQQRGVLR
jgi:cytochrome bd-type quinol oxidase subunit 2